MASRSTLADSEITNINDLQEFLSNSGSEDIEYSAFANDEFVRFSRSARFDQKLEILESNETVIFIIPEEAHFLFNSDLVLELPSIKVKEKYIDTIQISYIEKTLIYMVKEARTFLGENELDAELTNYSIDQYVEFYGEKLWEIPYSQIINNCQGETTPCTSIDSKMIFLPQPFFYSSFLRKALKRVLIPNARITHRYIFNRDLVDLVKIRKLENDVWTSCPSEDLYKYCDISGINQDKKTKIPELWGSFANTNRKELENYWIPMRQNNKYLDQIQEIVQVQIPNDEINGSGTIAIEIKEPGCVRGIFWSILSLEENDNKNYFEYTNKGKDNCVKTTLQFGSKIVWKNLSSFHNSKRLPRLGKLRTPEKFGYHYLPISFLGILREGNDTQDDLLKLETILKIEYKTDGKCKIFVFLDMHRILEYSEDKILIHTVKGIEQ